MKNVSLLALLAAVGCGKPAPEPITRTLPAHETSAGDGGAELLDDTDPDGGDLLVDGGVCCPVAFAVTATADDATATLVMNATSRVALSRDGGGWFGEACMPLEPVAYFYEVGLATGQEDGGLFLEARINEGVSSVVGNLSRLNLYEPGDAGTCAELDAGVHGTL